MSGSLDRFKTAFNQLHKDTLHLLDEIYAPDVEFRDPVHELNGLPALREWIANCKKAVSWKGSFSWEGTELLLIKHGIGNPNGSANGDLQKGVNEPLYAAVLAVDMKRVPCQIATAVMVGANKAPLATIAV